MPQFDPSTFSSQIFWLLISLGIVIGAFVFIFVPRINAILENRSKKVRQDMERAHALNQQIEGLLKAREERIRAAEEKADAIIQGTLEEMEDKKTRQYEIVDAEIATTIKDLHESIERQKQALQASLKPLVHECMQQVLPKLIGDYQETQSPEKATRKRKA